MPLEYNSKKQLQEKIQKGIKTLTEYVSSTLGPKGRNVILHQKDTTPIITKDGVTVANFVSFEDPFENIGAQVLKQASQKTANDAGDGTTTTTVLASAIYEESQKYISAGLSPTDLKRGMEKAAEDLVGNLHEQSNPVSSIEDIERVATISANNDQKIGSLIAEAIEKAGRDGAINIEEGNSLETTLQTIEGFRIDTGWVASAFITDERRGAARLSNAHILITDHKVEMVEDMLPALELVARDGRPLVIVADNIEGQALAALIMNTVRGSLKILAVKPPRFGTERRKIMEDLAISTGATMVSMEKGMSLRDVTLEMLGSTKSVDAIKNNTVFMGGGGDPEQIDKRIDALTEEIKQTDDIHECERIQERITRLASGVSVIRVGGLTEVEMVERKHRIEDALEAVRSAQEEGIVVGGGMALLKARRKLKPKGDNEDQIAGYKIVLKACEKPFRQIADNCGLDASVCLERAEKGKKDWGYNFQKNKLTNFVDDGIIDPVKVTRCALLNAVSVAGTLITSNHAIVEV